MELSDQDLQQLTLDGDEMDQFLSTPKGMYEHQVKQLKPYQLRLTLGELNSGDANADVDSQGSHLTGSKPKVFMVNCCH